MTPATIAVYLAVGPIDLRGAFDRLAAITRQVLCLDPASGALFLFLNRKRNRLKALWWDRNGYTILYRRLSKGSFSLPPFTEADGKCIELSAQDFAQLLAGLPVDELANRRRIVH
ncbi:IS66 family insertion sequence element accessory protein TnpB [Sorangium sp. So ce590]|uniref:IS66 family insertion sequence element accessory protein TnpB n=1 Tax=Sorangium sp. So ce590 TaxID=3133317 RepID=UPI003F5E4844